MWGFETAAVGLALLLPLFCREANFGICWDHWINIQVCVEGQEVVGPIWRRSDNIQPLKAHHAKVFWTHHTQFHEMVPNSAHFMATLKLAMKQGLLEGQTRAQQQGDFTITSSTKELEHSTLVLQKTSPNILLWCSISLLQSQANKSVQHWVLSSSKPFIPSFCIKWKLIWLPFTMKLEIHSQPNGPHNIFSFTNPITWKLSPMASLKVIFQFLSSHLKIIPITIGNNLQTYDGENLPMIG